MLDWKPVVSSLLSKVQDAGFRLLSVDDGEEVTKLRNMPAREARRAAAEAVTGVDISYVSIEHRDDRSKRTLFIVLGNDACEILADYTVDARLDPVSEEFYEQWEGRNVPTLKTSQ